ncbi:MAG: hypothetical protein JST25_11965 [Actinobacteria bacterium]|nr:hypothetical protein [Actinomycetota bacterium]
MNTSQNESENTTPAQSRPFGFWITAVDRLLKAEFATAFEDEGITRRDWRILNILDGTARRVPARALPDHKLRRLADLGWIERTAEGWALTTDGTAAKARLSAAVEEIRAQVAGTLDPEEFAAMAASLEKLARGLGYEDGMRLPRRPGAPRGAGRRGHHHGHGHPHGRVGDFGGFGGERFREARFGCDERFERSERPGFPGEHPRDPRGGHRRHSAEHIHIHLHDSRHHG